MGRLTIYTSTIHPIAAFCNRLRKARAVRSEMTSLHQSSALCSSSEDESFSGPSRPSWMAYLIMSDMRRRSLSSESGPGLENTLTLPISEASLRGLARLFCPFLSFISIYSFSPVRRHRLSLRSPHRRFRSSRLSHLPRYRSYSPLASVRAFFKGRSLSCAGVCGPASYSARIWSVGP